MAKTSLPNNHSKAKFCGVSDCDRPRQKMDWCHKHYQRFHAHGDPLFTKCPRGLGNTPESFWALVALTANPDKCWEWQGRRNSAGYGEVSAHGERLRAHRLAFEYFYGYAPTLHVLHSCDNPPCVNPYHLREGTAADNGQDRKERNRGLKTHCIKGHALSGSNLMLRKANPRHRKCRACHYACKNRIYAEKK